MRLAHDSNDGNSRGCTDRLRHQPATKSVLPVIWNCCEYIGETRGCGQLILASILCAKSVKVWRSVRSGRRLGSLIRGDQVADDRGQTKEVGLRLRGVLGDHAADD